jgi:UDP-glucose 4-epimerase
MTILVSGASGFLGRHLCRRLHATGAEVHAVSRRAARLHEDAHRWWRADLANGEEACDLMRAVKPDTIVHLGALTHSVPDLELVLPTFHSVLMSTVNLLTAVAEQGCRRVILAGSLEEPANGSTDIAPASPYAVAKWAAAAYGRMFHALYRTPVVVARLSLTYGPGQAERKVIPSTIRSLLSGESPRVSSGMRLWDFVYVDDAIDAIVRLVDGRGADGSMFDIGSGRTETLRSVIERLVGIINPKLVPAFGAVPDRPLTLGRAAAADVTEAALGWRATTSLEVGLQRTVQWYRSHPNADGKRGVAA